MPSIPLSGWPSVGVGLLIALDTVGVDFGFLLVFAGAIGVGIGLGLQSMAANLISGFIIIFGGKVRKGDWIKVEDAIGMITDIHALSTRVRTRGNVEYLLPNSNLVSNTIINYTLSSPMIWISLPVGVSYGSDPKQVERDPDGGGPEGAHGVQARQTQGAVHRVCRQLA